MIDGASALKAKNLKRSDETESDEQPPAVLPAAIRDQLKVAGWTIEDTPAGPRTKRLN